MPIGFELVWKYIVTTIIESSSQENSSYTDLYQFWGIKTVWKSNTRGVHYFYFACEIKYNYELGYMMVNFFTINVNSIRDHLWRTSICLFFDVFQVELKGIIPFDRNQNFRFTHAVHLQLFSVSKRLPAAAIAIFVNFSVVNSETSCTCEIKRTQTSFFVEVVPARYLLGPFVSILGLAKIANAFLAYIEQFGYAPRWVTPCMPWIRVFAASIFWIYSLALNTQPYRRAPFSKVS